MSIIMKSPRHESSKLRKSARGMECNVRLPNICNWNPETTILAHKNGGGTSYKTSDFMAAFCCSDCHLEVDRKTTKMDAEEVKLAHAEGIFRTQQYWLDIGLIKLL
jgi:hypothetical protein